MAAGGPAGPAEQSAAAAPAPSPAQRRRRREEVARETARLMASSQVVGKTLLNRAAKAACLVPGRPPSPPHQTRAQRQHQNQGRKAKKKNRKSTSGEQRLHNDDVDEAAAAAATCRSGDNVAADQQASSCNPAPGQARTILRITVALSDCLNVACELAAADPSRPPPLVLVNANGSNRGGGWLTGAGGQEESVCRRTNLGACLAGLRYPMPPTTCYYVPQLLVFRADAPADFRLLPAAEHCWLAAVGIEGLRHPDLPEAEARPDSKLPPSAAVPPLLQAKVRRVLEVARANQHRRLVLSALGCGAYATPPAVVARAFHAALCSEEFSGCFQQVVFAIKGAADRRLATAFRAEFATGCPRHWMDWGPESEEAQQQMGGGGRSIGSRPALKTALHHTVADGEPGPAVRQGQASAMVPGLGLVVVGGRGSRPTAQAPPGRHYLADAWLFSESTQEWTRLDVAPGAAAPSARWSATLVLDPTDLGSVPSLLLFGGRGTDGKHNDLWRLRLDPLPCWECLAPGGASPPPLNGHSATVLGTTMWVFGGCCDGADPVAAGTADGAAAAGDGTFFSNRMYALDLERLAWTDATPAGSLMTRPHPRYWHSAAAVPGGVLIFGGFCFVRRAEAYFNDAWLWTGTTFVELVFKGDVPAPRNRAGLAVLDTGAHPRLLLHGGNYYDPATRTDVFFSDAFLLTLLTLEGEGEGEAEAEAEAEAETAPARAAGGVVVAARRMEVDTGCPSRGHHSLHVWPPRARHASPSSHCAAEAIVLFGGEQRRTRFNDLSVLDVEIAELDVELAEPLASAIDNSK